MKKGFFITGVWVGLFGLPGVMAEEIKNTVGPASKYYQMVDSADMKLAREQWSQAEEYLKRGLKEEPANPGNTLLFSNLGVAQMQQGKLEEALVSFSLALTRAPKSTVIRTHRARTLLTLNRKEEAIEDIEEVLKIDSINEWGLQTRGLLLLDEGNLKTLTAHYPENPWGWFGMGAVAEEKGDEALAEEQYQKAYSLDHGAETGFRLSMLLLKNDKIQQALKILRETLREHPTDGNLYAAMGWAHKKLYQNEEAAADLKLAEEYGASPEILRLIRKKLVLC